MTAPASSTDISILSACAFLGNIGASLSGFGQAIIFLFVWQIVALAGYDGDFKTAVFIQALSLFSMQPVVLYNAKVWADANFQVLWLFVPITLVSTPLGQLLSNRVPTDIIQAVAGSLVLFVALRELYKKRDWLLSVCRKSKPDEVKETSVKRDAADDDDTGDVSAEINPQEQSTGDDQKSSDKESAHECNNMASSDEIKPDVEDPLHPMTLSPVYASMTVEPSIPQSSVEKFQVGLNKATFITLLAGGASGFFGGMVSIPGPPLLFYFIHPPSPITFNKKSQRATGVVIMFCIVLMREIYYFVDTFTPNASGNIVFVKEDWRLYLSVIVCSVVGGLTGSKLFDYVKDSQDTIRGVLAIFLFLCGISLLFSAFT